jgi:inhibitor of KinA sporulation pathway (predicted exonuclease)
MERILDKILVVDLEATCWQNDPPSGEQSEIIEIGLCELDVATGTRGEPQAILINPQRSELSEFCRKLTTLTPEMLANGLRFEDACALLVNDFRSQERTWASYGDYDRLQFQSQCSTWGVPYPFGRSHINVKNLLALSLGLKQEVDLQRGMRLLGLPFEGTVHRGVDDAWNIAAMLSRMLLGQDRQV